MSTIEIGQMTAGRRPGAHARGRRVRDTAQPAAPAPSGGAPGVSAEAALIEAAARVDRGTPLAASALTGLVGTRPPGGRRRADVATDHAPTTTSGPTYGKRARRGLEGPLVDGYDASRDLALACDHWDAQHILAHTEIAKIALGEAVASLSEERRALGVVWVSRARRNSAREIDLRATALDQAFRTLCDLHDGNVVSSD